MSPLRRIRSVAIDVGALRASRSFRWLFLGHSLSGTGSQITVVALMYHVNQLTHSPLAVGAIGLAWLVPTVAFGLAGGAVADAMDRRTLLLLTQVSQLLTSGALAVLAFGEPPLWSLYALAAAGAAGAAIDNPARSAIIPNLVPPDQLRSAVQLRESLTQISRLAGPALAGVLIAIGGVRTAYAVDAATFLVSFAAYTQLPSQIPLQRRTFELSSITEGWSFVRQRPVLASTFVVDLFAMILGMPRAVFPAMAEDVFRVGPELLGLLYAAPAAGALAMVAFAGWTSRVRREGLAVLVSVALWGAFIAGFGLTTSFALAVLLLAAAGAADTISAIFRQTILWATVPDELRGRISSIHIVTVTGGPPLGDLEAGLAAEAMGVRPSVVFGGVGCIAGVAGLAVKVPAFARWVDPARSPRP